MTITLTAEEYYDLRKRAITPEQWQAKKARIKKAVRELIDSRMERSTFAAGEYPRLPGQAQKFVDDVLRILEPEGDIYDPQNNPNQRKETCPHS